MNKQNLMPHQAQPVTRITSGQLPSDLAELSEETLNEVFGFDHSHVLSHALKSTEFMRRAGACSYDGDDAE